MYDAVMFSVWVASQSYSKGHFLAWVPGRGLACLYVVERLVVMLG